jgi:PAS domain S-box-containing protein
MEISVNSSDEVTKRMHDLNGRDEFERAFERAPDGMALVNEAGVLQHVNQALCELLDLEDDDLVGHHFLQFCRPEHHDTLDGLWDDVTSGQDVRVALPVVGRGDRQRQSEVAARRIEGEAWPFVMLVVRDVSADREAVDRLAEATKKLERMGDMQLVAQLAGGLVHDLNNMLAVINSYGQLLKQELTDRPELLGDVDEIIEAGETASSLSRRLLSVGRDRDADRSEVDDLDLNAEIERLVSFLSRVMPPRVEVQTRLDADRPVVEMSSVELEQALLNLILNARDAVEDAGRIVVETDIESAGEAEGFERRFVAISVRDDGCGMSEEQLSRIFEPFFTTKGPGEGTGMGLPMVRRITEEAGGAVDASSQPGEGTCMTLRLPLSNANGSDVGIEETTHVVDETGYERVLVVDGNATSRRLIQRVLAGSGYDVLVAKDQTEARRIVAGEMGDFDLLILDASPKNASARRLAADLESEFDSLRCIYTVEECKSDVGDFHVLERPITPSSLGVLVRDVLDGI